MTVGVPVHGFDAVVLAGGASSRHGGIDKMLVEVGGVRLLDRSLSAVREAGRTIVVGPPRPVLGPVTWVREEPPGSGPVAALAAGLDAADAAVIVLLAADLPFVTERHVNALLDALGGEVDGALFVDPAGRDQPLLSAWRVAALRSVLPEAPAGHGLRRVLSPLSVRRLPGGDDLMDCDTPAEVEAARRRAGQDPTT